MSNIALNVVLIDDDVVLRVVLVDWLRRLGHEVLAFADPLQALAHLPKDTDLVISDISLPNMDGFSVAATVCSMPGNQLPKVLLISGEDHQMRLALCPPSQVIGLMLKPFSFAHFSRILTLLEQTRTRCPGTIESLCPHSRTLPGEPSTAGAPESLCFSARYAGCLHYNAKCGETLRCLVAAPGA
jgi:CheY-like chemotaxis protein